MASTIILSDNGASSGSAGLKQTAGNDGVLILQTTTSGGTATNAIYVDNLQNIGVGSSAPTSPAGQTRFIQTGNAAANGYVATQTANSVTYEAYAGGSAAYVQSSTNHPLVFGTNNTERARIDSRGNLLVGTTSVSSYIGTTNGALANVQSFDGSNTNVFAHSGSITYGPFIYYPNAAPNSTGREFLTCQDSSAVRLWIRSNGGVANFSANNVNLSDRREKTNFAPAGDYLAKICAIPVQTFNYIDQNLEEDAGLTLGVVAQDVQAVAPELVMESDWGTKEQPKMRLSIYQTDLQYALMKAIQELKAELDTAKEQIAILQGAQQ